MTIYASAATRSLHFGLKPVKQKIYIQKHLAFAFGSEFLKIAASTLDKQPRAFSYGGGITLKRGDYFSFDSTSNSKFKEIAMSRTKL